MINEVLTLTYELLDKLSTKQLMKEMGLSSQTLAHWNSIIKETVVKASLRSQTISENGSWKGNGYLAASNIAEATCF